MARVVFETAALADCLKKAERIAPMKGSSFDKAAGIVFDLKPDHVVVRATNIDVFFMQWLEPLETDGQEVSWRLPSKVLAGTVSGLPIGTGKTVTMEQKVAKGAAFPKVHLTSGRTKVQLNLMDVDLYPEWSAFDPDAVNMVPVNNLGGRIAQVEWAASRDNQPPFAGLNLDGRRIVATDRYRCATVPFEMPLAEGSNFTIPANMLTPVLKQMGEMKVGMEGNFLLIMPDEETQVRAIMWDVDYPPVSKIMRVDAPEEVSVKKTALCDMIRRAINFTGSDRDPTLVVFLGKEELAVWMSHTDVGQLGDVIDTPGQAMHERVQLHFSPTFLLDALDKAPNEDLTLRYEPANTMRQIYINGGSGYEAWVAPRAKGSN